LLIVNIGRLVGVTKTSDIEKISIHLFDEVQATDIMSVDEFE